jgi:D-amino-acid oxidase
VDRLADLPGDVVVLAAGLGSGALLGDDTGVPVQGPRWCGWPTPA